MTDRLTILVVDDEPVVLDSTRKILDSERLRVLTAPDAETAQRILSAEAPDIVISDLVLPGASGMKLLETASEQDPGLLIVITTGYATVENTVAALKHGAFDFLPKPFTCDELVSCVDRAERAIARRLNLSVRSPGPGRPGDFHLGVQTWARPDRDGTALLGVTELQLQIVEQVQRVELPEVGAELRQGGPLVCLLTADGLAHTVWSPLGGRVVAGNEGLLGGGGSLSRDPGGGAWIARIVPVDLEGELPHLTEC